MDKILISACLLGEKTKYDGGDNFIESLLDFTEFFDVVPFCPEVEGGLPIPRKKSEIYHGKVKSEVGKDVTSSFRTGASKAVSICKFLGIQTAILKENSPSCGTHKIYDGSFSGVLISGMGFTAQELVNAGVKVLNEQEGLELLESLKRNKAAHDEAVAKAKERNFEPVKAEEKPAPKKEKPAFRKEKAEPFKKEGRSFKDKKSFGDKKTFGDKKRFGDKKGKKPFSKGERAGEKRSPNSSKKRFDRKPRTFKKK